LKVENKQIGDKGMKKLYLILGCVGVALALLCGGSMCLRFRF
jgi:hypothetical protein